MCLVTLNQEMNNKLTVVNLPKVNLYFSYETLIALKYVLNNRHKLVLNSKYLHHSKTTTKHFNRIKQLEQVPFKWKSSDKLMELLNFLINF